MNKIKPKLKKIKKAETRTRKFFRKKYGNNWRQKMNPKKKDWILIDEYYKKFREFLGR